MHHLFLDESGELGWHQNSSKYFVIAILSTDTPKKLGNSLKKEKAKLYNLGWPKDLEIKGSTLYGSNREPRIPAAISDKRFEYLESIISRVLDAACVPHYCVVRKSRITQNLRNAPYGIAYNYFSGKLLCRVYKDRFNGPITLIVDRRSKETHGNLPFDGYIQTHIITECEHTHAFHIRHEESHVFPGLQAVDFVSWGLFRHYEHGDNRFYKLITSKIGICDNWYA